MNPLKFESKALRFAENIRRRLCICEAVEYFREGLRPFVELRLKLAYGSNWMPKVIAVIERENEEKGQESQKIAPLLVDKKRRIKWDSRSLLKTIRFTFEKAFKTDFDAKDHFEVIWLRDRLNDFFHENPFSLKETKLIITRMESLLVKIADLEQAKLVDGVLQRLTSESPAVLTPSDKPRSPMEAGQSMSKPEARRHAQQCGITVTSDMRFANINSTVQTVWWLNIPTKIIRREGDVTILLYDNRNGKLHCLQVPTSHFKENRGRWKTRKSDDRIELELSTQEGDLFRDRCSKGKISFAQFHRGEC